MLSTLDRFKEGISNEIFSIIDLKIKKNFYELTPFRVQDFLSLLFFIFFFFFFFCSRGSRSNDTCSLYSRIFVDNSDNARKIDSSFAVTKNSLENLDICELMKYLNNCSVVLNLYYYFYYI